MLSSSTIRLGIDVVDVVSVALGQREQSRQKHV